MIDRIGNFIESIESRIHAEVFKLYPEANPPAISAERLDEKSLAVRYRSHRPLALFAISLARQSALQFESEIAIDKIDASTDGRRAEFQVRVLP